MERRALVLAGIAVLSCIPDALAFATLRTPLASPASVGLNRPTRTVAFVPSPAHFSRVGTKQIATTPVVGVSGHASFRKTRLVTASSAGDNTELPSNATSSNFVEPGLPKGLRPIGVDDRIEGISQAPRSLYEEYRQKAEASGGVGNKIGLEKQEGGQDDAGGFSIPSSAETAEDRMAREEFNLVNAFSSERGFVGAGVGIVALLLVYTSLYNGGGGTSGSMFGNYGAPAAPGKTVITERFEEAYLCYGIPSPDDPNGCKDKRSVGPVRVFSREPAGAPQSAPATSSDSEQVAPAAP